MTLKSICVAAAVERERRAHEDQAKVDAVVAEFDGDAARMAAEILYWRCRVKWLAETIGEIENKEPVALIGPGPYWKPGDRAPGWWR